MIENEYEADEEILETPDEDISGEIKSLEQATKKTGALLSPEGIILLPFAVLLDIAGVLFTVLDIAYGIGEIPSWISDGIGIIFLGLWLLIRSQTRPKELVEEVVEKHRAAKRAVKTVKGKGAVKAAKGMGRGLKFAISMLGEILPLVGALPFWTWMVWSELTTES